MICKTLVRKGSPRYRQLLTYILQPVSHLTANERGEVVFKHNVFGDTCEQWSRQFVENEQYRRYRRRDSTMLVHEIISFHAADSQHVTNAFLKDFLNYYAQLRADRSMFVGVVHRHQGNVHVHIGLHALNFRTGYSVTKKKPEYRSMLRSLQNWPQIVHSTIDLNSSKERTYSDKEYQLKRRTGKASSKDRLIAAIGALYQQSTSRKDFLNNLTQQEIQPYYRRDKLTGIITSTGRKFRFRTLGISDDMLQELDRQHETSVDRQPKCSPYYEKTARLQRMRKRSIAAKERERE